MEGFEMPCSRGIDLQNLNISYFALENEGINCLFCKVNSPTQKYIMLEK